MKFSTPASEEAERAECEGKKTGTLINNSETGSSSKSTENRISVHRK